MPFRPGTAVVTTRGFESFYAHHRETIARALAFAFNNRDLGYEAADEAMARAFRRWSSVSSYSNPEGWVFKVGLNWGRSSVKRRFTALIKAPMLLAVDSRAGTIDEMAPDPDLARAIAGLGHDHRAVVVLRYFLDYSVAQIAEVLNVPEGTVKSRLSRAMDRLAAELEPSSQGKPHEA